MKILKVPENECLEHDDPEQCSGPVFLYESLSGSGESFLRCEKGYDEYVQRVRPKIDEIRKNYPDSDNPPEWFDPTYAGEQWNES